MFRTSLYVGTVMETGGNEGVERGRGEVMMGAGARW